MNRKKKKKLLIITGSRAEYGLFKSTILELKKSKIFNVKLLVTGMHTLKKYGLTANEIRKDMHIDCLVPIQKKDDMLTALVKEIDGIKKYLKKGNLSAILVIGDRDEQFAGAVVGIHLNIPVIHVSGGDISGPTVDHYLRNAITIFSKLHLVQTQQSKKNVIKLGTDKNQVCVVGSAGLNKLGTKHLISKKELAGKLKLKLNKKWFLASMHPTPFDKISFKKQIGSVVRALKKLDKDSQKIIIYPNADVGSEIFIRAIESLAGKKNYRIFRNLKWEKYLSLLYNCDALIGNTSSGIMEAGYLKKPFILVGNRQGLRERCVNTIEVPYETKKIIKAVDKALSKKFQARLKKTKSVYLGGDVAGRIVKHIENFLKRL